MRSMCVQRGLEINTVCPGKNREIAEGKLPLFTKGINCLIVKCELEEMYKSKGVSIRRLFGI